MLREHTMYVFRGTSGMRSIDRITTLTALDRKITFTDDKEGVLGCLLIANCFIKENIDMQLDRRELCSLLPLALYSSAWASGASPTLASGTFPFSDLQPRQNANGSGEVRNIVQGTTPTGEQVEVHETALRPGGTPHAPHRHKHSEFWLIREGTVEITINGRAYKLGPGSAAFAASNDEHGIKNVGDVLATYFVVAIGPS